LFEFKEGENYNLRNTLKYFEDYNLSLTPKSGKLAICGWALFIFSHGRGGGDCGLRDLSFDFPPFSQKKGHRTQKKQAEQEHRSFTERNKQGRILIINYWHYHPTKLSS